MATNKTANLGLNSWIGSDSVKRAEINENFDKLDAKAKENADKINVLNSQQINVKDAAYGAVGDGINVDFPAIDAALTATNGTIKEVVIPDGVYLINNTIVVPRNVRLKLGQNAVIKPVTGDFNVFQLKPQSSISGGQVDLSGVTFTKAIFYFDADDVFQFYGQSHYLENINCLAANPGNGAFTGTGILMEAKAPGSVAMPFIDNVKCNNLTFINLEKVIHLRVDSAWEAAYASDNTKMAWVNANYFHQITAQNFKYGIYLEGTSNVPRDVAGNYFHGQFQAEPTTEAVLYCESAYNIFDIFLWDVHKMPKDKPAIWFGSKAKFNRVISATTLEMANNWRNDNPGGQNHIDAPGNFTQSKMFASGLNMPYAANMYGNQDDALVRGNLRGYTITQTKGPAGVGNLADLLNPDTEYGVTWDTSTTDYNNPIVLEINMTSDPVWYLQYFGASSPYFQLPEGLLMEGYDGNTAEWIWLHEFGGNKSSAVNISPPYSVVDKCTKLRLTFYGWVLSAKNTQKKVTISRLFATSGNKGGNMYMERFASKLEMVDPDGVPRTLVMGANGQLGAGGAASNTVSSSLPPTQSGKPQMIGNQDDVLANLPSWATYTVNLAKAAGEHINMWDIRAENFASYNTPTVASPLIIEMDFTANPLSFVESLGVAMQWGESAKNVKFEVVKTSGGAYSVAKDITGNTDDVVQIAYRASAIYKIKITLSEVNNTTTNRVKIGRIFATSGKSEATAFIPRHGGNMYGPLGIAKVTTLPTASAAYRGQMLRVEGGTSVADKIYVCLKSATETYSWVQFSAGS
ncbi:Pectate lyase superfamily protein [Fictibacillus enclensis]|uniref:Rhamnogalacturonase A/B/Epimerase-like pectate lyase domain-containing protein n=1 Tax=Fictibacillus enclensis TaxID=1017270 RepID=A0A0V8J8G2_9BACL|nr:glycosyl hydrolase family 28-related protein [Fictibacillus enclensis]KSU83423.1 hypothetical protein AS030_12725 [Fictibacillus enclensis]SCC15236.1 Pectate lyase superfamily protein [Fictibacillus enclensis]